MVPFDMRAHGGRKLAYLGAIHGYSKWQPNAEFVVSRQNLLDKVLLNITKQAAILPVRRLLYR